MRSRSDSGLGRKVAFWARNWYPARLARDGFGAWPNGLAGKSSEELRLLARRRLVSIATRYEGADFAALAAQAADDDARRDDRHQWVDDTLRVAAAALRAHPPGAGDRHIRREALELLDYPLSLRRNRRWETHVRRFYRDFMDRALSELIAAEVTDGLHVWKMYNMGFVVRTRSRCIGFDVHPGGRVTGPLSSAQQRDLVDLLDIVFISHLHVDHLHSGFLKRLLDAGKTVVLPPTLRPGLQRPNAIRVYAGSPTRFHAAGVEVTCLPGWQRFIVRNNVYLVTVDGHRVLHNGDNTRHGVYYHLADEKPIDLVLANCWSGFGHGDHIDDAALLITGHENELGHAVSMRAPYRASYAKFDRLHLAPEGNGGAGPDCRVLTWGESLRWRRDA